LSGKLDFGLFAAYIGKVASYLRLFPLFEKDPELLLDVDPLISRHTKEALWKARHHMLWQ
jgi:hypothetical protein